MDNAPPQTASGEEQRISTADLARAYETPAAEQRQEAEDRSKSALLPSDEVAGLRSRWNDIQTGFVDEPRRAV
jgi:hypothetical protein